MPAQITLKMTDQFFDRAAIQAAVRRAGRDFDRLGRAGAMTRQNARRSLRRVQKRHHASKPGRPPRTHAPDDFNLRKILYIWDPYNQAMIVGPVGGGQKIGKYTVPELHEEGGNVSASQLSEWDRHFLARLRRDSAKKKNRRRGPTARNGRGQSTKAGAHSKKQAIAYIRKVESGALPNRDPQPTGSLHYPARPFMLPALKQISSKFPELWEGSVHP